MFRSLSPSIRLIAGALLVPGVAAAQAAVDPSVAPRAAAMASAGDRVEATEMLGRYLATAPDDGAAWLELGRFYLLDSRGWHENGHIGDPNGALFLDLAATALDESLRLPTDSGRLLRAMVEVDRASLAMEQGGWPASVAASALARSVEAPPYVVEAGRNLVSSCPMGGVMVTGSDIEAVGVWSIVLRGQDRADLVLFLPALYGADSVYRVRMAETLQIDAVLPVAEALTRTAERRPVCLAPDVDSTIAPHVALVPLRMVRVAGTVGTIDPRPLSIIELTTAWRSNPTGLVRQVADLYLDAARANRLLCASLLTPLGVRDRSVCGR
ncbi:MAG TPA: hypothetical protein VG692_16485 [Gemmatimonadales bacterium]|nr:hypothetical protein [Gemmatimonadales bacterium]